MRTRRETKGDADVQREFKTTRFLWVFAEEWRTAKKENVLGKFWTGLSSALTSYDIANPAGRRFLPAVAVQGTRTSPIPKNPINSQPQKQGSVPTTKDYQSTVQRYRSLTSRSNAFPPPDPPLAPVAGPSRPRTLLQMAEPSTRRDESATQSSHGGSRSPSPELRGGVPKPGVRIEGLPKVKLGPIEQSLSSDSDEGGDEGEKVIHVKPPPKQAVNKAGKKTHAETKQKDQKRRTIKSTGTLRDEPCARCDRMKYMCFDQIGGKACIHCAKAKAKCVGHGEEEGYTTEAQKSAPATRTVRVVSPAPLQTPSPPAPKRKTQSTKKKSEKQMGKARATDPEPVPVPVTDHENTSIGDSETGRSIQ